MKRTIRFFLALCLVASTNCRLDGEGLTPATNPGTGSGGKSGTGGTQNPGSAPATTGGIAGSGGPNASGGVTGSGSTRASGGVIGSGGATGAADASSAGGVMSLGGNTASGGTKEAGGGAGTGGSPNPDGATDGPSVLGREVPPELLADASADRSVDARIVDSPAIADDTNDAAAVDVHPAMTLVWSDEFGGAANTGIDTTKWSYVTWDPGHVNNEAQKYTNRLENVFQDGAGHLVIRALNTAGNAYTSGRIESNGHFALQYGRVEVRAKLPAGIGSFPGIVAMGSTGNWPQCGELAIVEQYGQDKSWFYVSATAGSGSGSGDTGNVKYTFPDATTASLDFHVYSFDWYTDHVVFQMDGIEITRTAFATSSPFYSIPEYLILDLALGGNMGGTIDPNAFPMDMIVDYVRVYSF